MTATTAFEPHCIHTFRVQTTQDDHTNGINAVAISPDNTKIAAVGDKLRRGDQWTFTLWDLTTGEAQDIAKTITYRTHKANIAALTFSLDSKFILIGSHDQTSYPSLSFWNLENIPEHTTRHPKGDQITAIASHPSKRQFVTVGLQGVIRLWQDDPETRPLREIQRWQGCSTHSVSFSADGNWICTGGTDRQIKIWDSQTGELIREFVKQDNQIRSIALSADNQILVSGSDQRIKIWDAQTGDVLHSFFGHPDWVRGVVITANNQCLISAGDARLKIWDLKTGQKLQAIAAHDATIRSMVMSRDGTLLVTGDNGGTVKVWQLQV